MLCGRFHGIAAGSVEYTLMYHEMLSKAIRDIIFNKQKGMDFV